MPAAEPPGRIPGYRHLHLLIALLLLVALRPFLPGERVLGLGFLDLLFFATVFAGVVSCARSRLGLALLGSLGAASLAARIAGSLAASPGFTEPLHWATAFAFWSAVLMVLLRRVFGGGRVSRDRIYGAVAIYLLMGLLWVLAYACLENLAPGSFAFGDRPVPAGAGAFETFLGFSFTTLTTLGYGNVVPRTPQAESLATLQAVAGQLYLAILVARLVGLHLAQRQPTGEAG